VRPFGYGQFEQLEKSKERATYDEGKNACKISNMLMGGTEERGGREGFSIQ
jgi:hypothetical protein